MFVFISAVMLFIYVRNEFNLFFSCKNLPERKDRHLESLVFKFKFVINMSGEIGFSYLIVFGSCAGVVLFFFRYLVVALFCFN